MVEDGRASGECELRQPGACCRVHGLLVDPRPDRIEGLQPLEEVRLLRTRACEGLVEVVVGVDKAGRDDGATEVDVLSRGRSAAPDGRDHALLDVAPAVGMLGAGVVHRDHVRAGQQHSGTSSKRSTSTRPWSVIFSAGMTESARNETVKNGVAPLQPSAVAASLQARLCAITSASAATE